MLPNPRMIMNQEVSIAAGYAVLFVMLKYTTEDPDGNVSLKAGAVLCLTPVALFFTIGLKPLLFLSAFGALALSAAVKSAFGRFTPRASKTMLAVFIPAMLILAAESLVCTHLQSVSRAVPWHLAFDLLFFQVLGTVVDVVMISPPGLYLKPWSSEEVRERGCAVSPPTTPKKSKIFFPPSAAAGEND